MKDQFIHRENENKSKIMQLLPYVVFVFALLCFVFISCPHRPGAVITGDPVFSYAPAIDAEFVCDWHSALYLQECILLKKILNFCSLGLTGIEILYVVWYLSAFVIVLLTCVMLFSFRKEMKMPLMLYAAALLLLMNMRGAISFLCIDFHFVAVIVSVLFVMWRAKRTNRKKMQYLWMVAFLLLLIQMVEVRKNAALLLPFLFAVELYIFYPRFSKKCLTLLAVAFSAIFLFSEKYVSEKLFVDQKTYPASVMMMSDLCLAATLRGDSETTHAMLIRETGYQLKKKTRYYRADIPYFPSFPVNEYDSSHWEPLKKIYFDAWINEFVSMFDARMLQVVQFYTGGYIPEFVIKYYDFRYGVGNDIRSNLPAAFNYKRYFSMLVWLIVAVVSILYTYYLTRKIVNKRATYVDTCVWVSSVVGILYAASFLVVTPTPDFRYRVVCLLLFSLTSSVAFVKLLEKHLLKRRERNLNQIKLN